MTHIGLDTIGADAANIPLSTETVGVYVTGSAGVPWTAAQIALLEHSGIARINQDNNPSPRVGNVFDLETHAGTVDGCVKWAEGKKRLGLIPKPYLTRSTLAELEGALAVAGVTEYWIWLAAPDISEAEAVAMLNKKHVKAVQFAWPDTKPSMLVPGSHLTLAQANVDVSVCADDWFPAPHHLHRAHGVAQANVSIDSVHGDWHIKAEQSGFRPGNAPADLEWWEAKVGFNRHTGQFRVHPLPPEKS